MPAPYRTTRRVQFHETDAAGIAHFSSFFRYMEEAEHEMLRHLGLSVHLADGEETISWPRVSASCDYVRPLRFEDVVEIEVCMIERGSRSVTYGFTFTHEGRPVARGKMTSVCCRVHPGEPPRSIAIPDWIAERITQIACENAADG